MPTTMNSTSFLKQLRKGTDSEKPRASTPGGRKFLEQLRGKPGRKLAERRRPESARVRSLNTLQRQAIIDEDQAKRRGDHAAAASAKRLLEQVRRDLKRALLEDDGMNTALADDPASTTDAPDTTALLDNLASVIAMLRKGKVPDAGVIGRLQQLADQVDAMTRPADDGDEADGEEVVEESWKRLSTRGKIRALQAQVKQALQECRRR